MVARATNDAIWDWNLATDGVEWNDGVRVLFGYAEKDVRPDAGGGTSTSIPRTASAWSPASMR